MSQAMVRRLFEREQVAAILRLPDADLQWLVDTCQLTEILIRGHKRYDSLDVYRLVDSYKTTASRRSN